MYNKISIKKLNECIDEYRHNMIQGVYYDKQKEITEEMDRKFKTKAENIYPVKLYNQEQAISIVLNFFKELGVEEWYISAKNILLGQDQNMKINIYDTDHIKDLDEVDENNMRKYTIGSCATFKWNEYKNIKANINISLHSWFKDLPNSVLKDNVTLRDMYSIVHEISHTFDVGNTMEIEWKKRFFAENIPFCLERIFGEYLVKNKINDEKTIESMQNERSWNSLIHARLVYVPLGLIKLKEKKENFTKENINKLLRENNIKDINFVRRVLNDIIYLEHNIDSHFAYAIAEITSGKFIEKYRKDEKQALADLQQYCKNIKAGNTSDNTLRLINCPVDENEACKYINEIVEEKVRMNDSERA